MDLGFQMSRISGRERERESENEGILFMNFKRIKM